jgi:hypothetical protein
MHTGADVNPAPLWGELQGVGQEVQKHLLDLALVATNPPEPLVDGAAQPDPALARPLPHQDQCVLDRGRQVELRQLQLHAPRLDLRQIQEFVDQGQEMPPRFQDVPEGSPPIMTAERGSDALSLASHDRIAS